MGYRFRRFGLHTCTSRPSFEPKSGPPRDVAGVGDGNDLARTELGFRLIGQAPPREFAAHPRHASMLRSGRRCPCETTHWFAVVSGHLHPWHNAILDIVRRRRRGRVEHRKRSAEAPPEEHEGQSRVGLSGRRPVDILLASEASGSPCAVDLAVTSGLHLESVRRLQTVSYQRKYTWAVVRRSSPLPVVTQSASPSAWLED